MAWITGTKPTVPLGGLPASSSEGCHQGVGRPPGFRARERGTAWRQRDSPDPVASSRRGAAQPSTPGFRGVWNLGSDNNNGYAVAADGTTVYVVGSGYKDAGEAYNQTIIIHTY